MIADGASYLVQLEERTKEANIRGMVLDAKRSDPWTW